MAKAKKSAWSQGLKNAPHDRMIMVRLEEWSCPAFVKWVVYGPKEGNWEGWVYVESLIADVTGGLIEDDNGQIDQEDFYEWAEVPV